MYYGMINCSNCYKEYEGVRYTGNLCPECSKIEEEKQDKLNQLLHNNFLNLSSIKIRNILFNFLMKNFEYEFKKYLIDEFKIKDESKIGG